MITKQFLLDLGFLPNGEDEVADNEFSLCIWDKTDHDLDPDHNENHPNHHLLFCLNDQTLWLEAYDAGGESLAITQLPTPANTFEFAYLVSLLSHKKVNPQP